MYITSERRPLGGALRAVRPVKRAQQAPAQHVGKGGRMPCSQAKSQLPVGAGEKCVFKMIALPLFI